MKRRNREIIDKAHRSSKELSKEHASLSYKRVVGVLAGLGFLVAPGIKKLPTSKLDILEAVTVGSTIEPRVLEVLPAAIVSFPKSFLHLDAAPERLKEVVTALRLRKPGPNCFGISFAKFLEAANRPIKNRKRKVISEKRFPKTFRFLPSTIQTILSRADALGLDHTAYIEALIRKDSALP